MISTKSRKLRGARWTEKPESSTRERGLLSGEWGRCPLITVLPLHFPRGLGRVSRIFQAGSYLCKSLFPSNLAEGPEYGPCVYPLPPSSTHPVCLLNLWFISFNNVGCGDYILAFCLFLGPDKLSIRPFELKNDEKYQRKLEVERTTEFLHNVFSNEVKDWGSSLPET